jgi:hypothetical protein
MRVEWAGLGMKVSERTVSAIADVVTGNKGVARYRSGPQLVRLFNEYGSNDVYGQGFPSRWSFAEDKVRSLNGTPELAKLVAEVLHPLQFVDIGTTPADASDYINARLKFDGYEVGFDATGVPVVRALHGSLVEFVHPGGGSEADAHRFLDEQLAKCDQKLKEGDYDGAVTNARSLTETVLVDLRRQLDPEAPAYDGDLPKLFKRVQRLLELEPERPDIDTPLKQVLSGLAGIVSGLAGISNKMGDRHVRTYRPAKRHAVLVVDSAKTLCNFLITTHQDRLALSEAPGRPRRSA